MRLVSLLPSATEMVGGRDTEGLTPAEIDVYVRAQMAGGEDLHTLRADGLAELQPELILTQGLCRVCALPSGQVSDALEYLGCRADVISLDPRSLDDVLDSILLVGRRAGVPESRGAARRRPQVSARGGLDEGRGAKAISAPRGGRLDAASA